MNFSLYTRVYERETISNLNTKKETEAIYAASVSFLYGL